MGNVGDYMNELISIIVPVYNIEKYIGKCIDSLIHQTYKKIEIICINDGSTDNSLNVIKKYKKNDLRIVIIDQKNMGVSQARNNALKIASGEYIMFVDGDDWIDIHTCEFALSKIKEKNADVILWTYVREYEDKTLIKNIFEEKSLFFNKEDVYLKIYRRIFGLYGDEMNRPDHGDSIVPVWGKLYRKDIIINHHIQFIDYKIVAAEDALFNMEYFSYVEKAYYEKKYYYHYRKNDSSLTRSFNENLVFQWNNLINYMESEIKNKNLDDTFIQALSNRRCLSIIPLGLNILYKERKPIKEISQLTSNLDLHKAIERLDFKVLPLVWKIFFFCSKYELNLGLFMLLKFINYKIH